MKGTKKLLILEDILWLKQDIETLKNEKKK